MSGLWRLVGILGILALAASGVACDSDSNATDAAGGTDVVEDTSTPPEDTGAPDDVEPSTDSTADEDATDEDTTEVVAPEGREVRLEPTCIGDFCAAGPDYAPDPEERGPFVVGCRTIDLVDETRQTESGDPWPIKVEIWYPTTDDYADAETYRYNLYEDAPPELYEMLSDPRIGSVDGGCVRDAPLRTDLGPYPLVVFSHGAFGVRFQSFFYTTPLASHGYIVVAPDHHENTIWDILLNGYDGAAVAQNAFDRIEDGPLVLDHFFAAAEDPESDFYEQIATKRVGFTGHSFGGFLSIYMGAADPRVKAVVPMSPATSMAAGFAVVDLLNYPVPQLTMGGDLDRTLEFDIYMWNPYQRMPPPKGFLRIFRGGHYTFTDMCQLDLEYLVDEMDWSDAEDALEDGCGPENYDFQLAQPVIKHYAIGFFNYYLRQSPGSAQYLDASYVDDQSDEISFDNQF